MSDAVLGVFTPVMGHVSETFVHRHATELLPGRTVVAAFSVADAPAWQAEQLLLVPRPSPCGPVRRNLAHDPGVRSGYALTWKEQRALRDSLRSAGVTHALLEYLDPWVPYLPAFRRLGIKVYAHGHGYDVSARLRQPWIARSYQAYAATEGVVVVSHHSAERLARLGIPRRRLSVIPCGTTVPDEAPQRQPGRRRWLSVGRMVPKKGPVHTVRAFAVAAQEHDIELDMVGDGPLLDDVLRTVDELGLGDRVHVHGRQPPARVHELMSGAAGLLHHALVDPASGDEEGLPVAVLEAMAAGLPVVATAHAGIPDAVRDGVTGLLVPEGDVAAMGAAVGRLAADDALNVRLGLAGWAAAKEEFSSAVERRRLLALMELGA